MIFLCFIVAKILIDKKRKVNGMSTSKKMIASKFKTEPLLTGQKNTKLNSRQPKQELFYILINSKTDFKYCEIINFG